MKVAHFHFDSNLSGLLRGGWRGPDLEYAFTGPQSAKHLIESMGIPHTEIGLLLVNGQQAETSYQVQDGDEVQVEACETAAASTLEPRFILDGHLGRLASRLRMLGLDCQYQAVIEDSDLAAMAVSEGRILVTRDRHLLMRKTIANGYLVRSLIPKEQLREIVERYRLLPAIKPFQRCIRCNTRLVPVPKADVLDRLEPLTRRYFDEFRICPGCNQIYWRGSHVDRMSRMIADL